MRWFWYVARPNEIFVDLDSPAATTRALSVLRRALNVKRTAKTPLLKLGILGVWLYPSEAEGHSHLIVVLKNNLSFIDRTAWSLWLGTDQIRAAYVMERFLSFACRNDASIPDGWVDSVIDNPSFPTELLSVRHEYGFRKPDTFCFCKEKHKKKHVTDKCSALVAILGDMRSADYFPRNRDRVKREPIRPPWGEISKTNLKRWRFPRA